MQQKIMDTLDFGKPFIIPSVIFTFIFVSVALIVSDRVPPPWTSVKRNALMGKRHPSNVTSHECPYSYIRQIYGTHHWAPFVQKLSPNLETENPKKYSIVLEIMDAIHLNLMLVDDVRNLLARKCTPYYSKQQVTDGSQPWFEDIR